VLFLGAFDERKGLRVLAAAWPEVHRQRPDARLTLVGKGPLAGLAEDLAADRPEVDLVVDPPRPRIHEALRSAALVVLASQRTATWREQVGLPLVEGLAHGCAVVTTAETGLADWLAADGHRVVDVSAGSGALAAAIVAGLDERRSRASVLAGLPEIDGRLAADAWMFSA
jgi:glycosyltransferase involved in cell wall biosynthesis